MESMIQMRHLLLLAVVCASSVFAGDYPVENLYTPEGFKVESVLKADPKLHGSWICMAKDKKGRLLLGGQRNQPVTRLTIKDGAIAQQENLNLPISETMGMLDVDGTLYVSGFGKNNEGKGVFGFFRCRDTKGEDKYDSVEFLREWQGGAGEHGAHGIVLGADKKLYVVNGNFTEVPKDLVATSPHRNFADDRALPRAEDGNGFGAGRKPPGGYVLRMDLDGKNAELFSSGQRNCYDIAFNADGELFGFDSDMEWDWGMPWYRPVRVFQAISGGDHGFREGTAKWPEHYADSLPAAVNIGIGCPTGVVAGIGAKFPLKFQKAIYILDWTYGRLIAVHLKPNGAGYTGSWENFVCPKGLMVKGGPKSPLNLTDAVIGDDGAMYFTVGGRGTGANLFRVTYTGGEPAVPTDTKNAEGAEARELRRKIEAFHGKEDAAALAFVWPHLSSEDRFIRYAARIAVERQPVEQWKSKALAETNPHAAFTALLALARNTKADAQPEIFNALAKIPAANEALLIDKLRVIQVSVARHGTPSAEVSKALVAELNPQLPAKTVALNSELAQVLLALEAPEAVAKTVALLQAAQTQEEQIEFVLYLRTAKKGWTPELRKQYFTWWTKDRSNNKHPDFAVKWFEDAGRGFGDGASFPKFLSNFHGQAKATMTPDEVTALGELATYTLAPKVKKAPPKARTLVKEWAMTDLEPSLAAVSKGRSFARGKEVYEASQCMACHKFGNEGGAVGPDLTAISARFSRKDVTESVIDPSKVISEQYQNTTFRTNDGKIVDGRVLEENDARVVVQPNPLAPEKVEIKKADIKSRMPSKLSPMPEGLLNNFTKEEILDLVAYMESGGKKDHPNFTSNLVILKAEYGDLPNGTKADVTEIVKKMQQGDGVTIEVTNEHFGDPVEGKVKRMRVEYSVDGKKAEATAAEGDKLVLPK